MGPVRNLPYAGSAPRATEVSRSTSTYPVSPALRHATERATHWTKLDIDSFATVLFAHRLALRVCEIPAPCCTNVDTSGESSVVVSCQPVRSSNALEA